MTTDQRAGRLLLAALILLMLLAACNQREDTRATDSLTSAPVAQATLPAASETATPLAAAVVTTSTRPPSPTPALPTATPAPTETPSPTATPAPTETPTITPTPTEPAPVLPAWLTYLNQFRAMAGLAALEELEPLNKGSQFHSRYMVLNDAPVAHSEDPANPYYSEDGDRAARNSNIFATYMIEANYVWSTNFWISAPFHLLGILDPSLRSVGYGAYNEATGKWQMAAVLDLRSEPRPPVAEVQYPIFFPGDGAETWIVRLSLFEWPNSYASCPGYQAPTGPAIAVLLGDGDGTPRVRSQVISKDGAPLDSCVFDETSYLNGDAWAQKTGRQILDNLDAVVIIPRQPLAVDNTYQVRVTTDEGTYEWQFHTRRPPEASE